MLLAWVYFCYLLIRTKRWQRYWITSVITQTLCFDRLLSSAPLPSFLLLKYHLRPGLFWPKTPAPVLLKMGTNYSNSFNVISNQKAKVQFLLKMCLEHKHFSKKLTLKQRHFPTSHSKWRVQSAGWIVALLYFALVLFLCARRKI